MKGDQISGLKSREGVRGLTTKDATDDDRGRQEEDGEEEEHGLTGKHWRRGEDIGLRASRTVVRGERTSEHGIFNLQRLRGILPIGFIP